MSAEKRRCSEVQRLRAGGCQAERCRGVYQGTVPAESTHVSTGTLSAAMVTAVGYGPGGSSTETGSSTPVSAAASSTSAAITTYLSFEQRVHPACGGEHSSSSKSYDGEHGDGEDDPHHRCPPMRTRSPSRTRASGTTTT